MNDFYILVLLFVAFWELFFIKVVMSVSREESSPIRRGVDFGTCVGIKIMTFGVSVMTWFITFVIVASVQNIEPNEALHLSQLVLFFLATVAFVALNAKIAEKFSVRVK